MARLGGAPSHPIPFGKLQNLWRDPSFITKNYVIIVMITLQHYVFVSKVKLLTFPINIVTQILPLLNK